MQAERAWGKHPGWFDSLQPEHQTQVLALAFAEAGLAEEAAPEPTPKKGRAR